MKTKARCSIDKCSMAVFGHGWCKMHHARWARHGDPLKKLRPDPAWVEADKNGEKQYNTGRPCIRGHSSNRWTISGGCVECSKTRASRKDYRVKKYGLAGWAEFEALKAEQGNKCAICFNEFSGSTKVHIDHCHATQKLRAVLCKNCNHGLGFFSDNPDVLRRAAAYIEDHSGRGKVLPFRKEFKCA